MIYFILSFIVLSIPLLWGDPALRIFYSSSLNGNLDGCTCKSNPRSGLVKRGFFLKDLDNRENTIILDAGDILDVMKDTLLADYIFESYDSLFYNAIALGESEFNNGIEKLLEYRSDFPLFSHNLIICPDEKSCVIFSLEPLIIKKKDFTIGIFSLFDPKLLLFIKPDIKEKIKVKEPEITARNMIVLLEESNVDIIICLFHGYSENVKKIITKVKGIDIVIAGHEQQLIDMDKTEDTFFVSPGKEGNQLGELTVIPKKNGGFTFHNRFHHFDYYTDPDDKSIRNNLEEYYEKMRVK